MSTSTKSERKARPLYEPPKLISLNDVTTGQGFCYNGSGDGSVCGTGASASVGACNSGGVALTTCYNGSTPSPI